MTLSLMNCTSSEEQVQSFVHIEDDKLLPGLAGAWPFRKLRAQTVGTGSGAGVVNDPWSSDVQDR